MENFIQKEDEKDGRDPYHPHQGRYEVPFKHNLQMEYDHYHAFPKDNHIQNQNKHESAYLLDI